MKKLFIALSFMSVAFIAKSQRTPVDTRTVTQCGYPDENFALFSVPPYYMFIGPDENLSSHTTHYDHVNHTWCADWVISCNSINEDVSVKSDKSIHTDTRTVSNCGFTSEESATEQAMKQVKIGEEETIKSFRTTLQPNGTLCYTMILQCTF